MPQYTLPLSLPAVFSEDNFFVGDCNRAAYEWVMRWPDWPSHALLLIAPRGSGKSHLSHIWSARAGALPFSGAGQMRGHTLLEDIETLKERELFHALNIAKEQGITLLLTGRGEWPFILPDLLSRLKALPSATISPPDDATLAAVLRKQFADRQLKIADDALAYLLPRMERSFAAIAATAEEIDAKALAEQRNLTVPFLKSVLGF